MIEPRQAWIFSRLLLGVNPNEIPIDQLAGLWKAAADAYLVGGLEALETWRKEDPKERDPLCQAAFAMDAGDVDPATVELRHKIKWTFDELLTTDFPDPEWTIPGILPVGLATLAGRPKVGKSWLALQWAVAISSGGRIFGQAIKPAKVLVLALEDSPRRLASRLKKQGAQLGTKSQAFTLWPTFGEHGGLARLQDEIDKMGYRFVVIDTLSRALGARADQMDIGQMTDILGELQHVSQTYDTTIVGIDHHRKLNGLDANPIDDIMGSTAKAAIVDAALGLYKEQGKQGATLKVIGRDIEERDLALQFDGLTGCWQLLGEAGEVRKDSTKGEILAAIRELKTLGELATSTSIARHIGKSQGYVSHMLADLLNDGKIFQEEKVGKHQPYGRVP